MIRTSMLSTHCKTIKDGMLMDCDIAQNKILEPSQTVSEKAVSEVSGGHRQLEEFSTKLRNSA